MSNGCCSACNGTGSGDANGGCWDCRGTGCAHPEPCPVDEPEQTLEERRAAEGRCQQCGNYLKICGHGLAFKERMKTVRANYIGWSETR